MVFQHWYKNFNFVTFDASVVRISCWSFFSLLEKVVVEF